MVSCSWSVPPFWRVKVVSRPVMASYWVNSVGAGFGVYLTSETPQGSFLGLPLLCCCLTAVATQTLWWSFMRGQRRSVLGMQYLNVTGNSQEQD